MSKNALVVVDMQNDFVTGVLGTPEARTIVKPMVEYVDKFDGPIYFTQDTHFDGYLNTIEGKKLPVEHCIEDTDGWKIIPELQKYLKFNGVFQKSTFGCHRLAHKLAIECDYHRIDNVILIGVCTGICVISNALLIKAVTNGKLNVQVKADLCACVTPESHKIALEAMKTCQIDII